MPVYAEPSRRLHGVPHGTASDAVALSHMLIYASPAAWIVVRLSRFASGIGSHFSERTCWSVFLASKSHEFVVDAMVSMDEIFMSVPCRI